MSYYYPQSVLTLRVRWEDFSNGEKILNDNYKLTVLAKDVTVQINDYTKADTFSATIDYKAFPFDPRCIRALGVTVHMENKRQTFVSNSNSADFNNLNLIKPSSENTIFTGFADEQSISFDDTSRTVSFEGRDFTSLLVDAPFSKKTIDLGRPLDTILTELINELETTKNLKIDNRTGEDLPNIGSYAPDYNPLGKDRSAKKKENYWDVITELVQLAGLISYIELDELVITKPRNLYADTLPTQLVYGKNLSSLEFKRKLGRQKGVNVNVRSANLQKKEVIQAKIPEEATEEWAKALGIARSRQKIQKIDTEGEIKEVDAPFMTFNVANIANVDQLIKIGEGIWEEIGRQQIEGSLATKEMCIEQLDPVSKKLTEINTLKFRNGTPIKVEISADDLDRIAGIEVPNDIGGIDRKATEAKRERFLRQRCYEPAVAKAFAKTLGKFDTRFYTKQVEFSMSQDNGFEMRIEFINFVEVSNKALGING